MLDPKAKQQVQQGLRSAGKTWGGALSLAMFVAATVAVLRIDLGWLVAWVPGVARASLADIALAGAIVCGTLLAARLRRDVPLR